MVKTAKKSSKGLGPLAHIQLKGVRQNNLKNFDLDIPIGKLVVVTGLSGAGKSSLVFETLHAEGNRRYAETFSPYVRQFLEMTDRPDVDSIENIRPSIAVEQGNTVKTSRSTVGTMTELCDYFKVWFAQVAQLIDPKTNDVITSDTPQFLWNQYNKSYQNNTLIICFEIKKPDNINGKEILKSLAKQGYTRVILNDEIIKIEAIQDDDSNFTSCISVIQDRIKVTSTSEKRFLDAVETAYNFGNDQLEIRSENGKLIQVHHEDLRSKDGTRKFRPVTPNLFSFNSPMGACSNCRGFGRVIEIDPRLVIPDYNIPLAEGAIKAFSGAVYSESQRDLITALKKAKINPRKSWAQLTPKEKSFIYDGDPDYSKKSGTRNKPWYGITRFFSWLLENTYKMHVRVFLSRYRSYVTCPVCNGKRLQKESLCWKWKSHTLPDLYELSISKLYDLVRENQVAFNDKQAEIAQEMILTRLKYLEAVGLSYLNLNRSSRSLSGGETQRVNLTSCLGTSLVDTLFILDEPSIGLHCRDIDRLVGILRKLCDLGNTVVVVEHDESIMKSADHIIEIGPEPGTKGGQVNFNGSPHDLLKAKNSITGDFLAGRKKITTPKKRRSCMKQPNLRFSGISKHNIKNLNLKIPLQRFVVLSGVSGSGKSTLLNNAIYQGLLARGGTASNDPAQIKSIESDLGFSKILLVDQSPVSKTPRSTPALYVNAWDPIRELFAQTDSARSSGFNTSSFSFNSGQGRCPHCDGLGYERVEMQFMADVYVECSICEGKRFSDEVLAVKWYKKSIADVLALTVSEAIKFFEGRPKITNRLQPLIDLGLGYLPLGQPLNSLSGGESQRLKLVVFMGQIGKSAEHALLLLDEPTTGLHKADVRRLLHVLHQLVDNGHSLILIEHHPDLIKHADWLIEIGPEAGDEGGKIVFEGTPDQLKTASSHTAPFIEEAMGTYKVPNMKKSVTGNGSKRLKNNLSIYGANEHNLKNISLTIPQNSMTVVTGVSGSGKSTLAFDIVFAEGQRRFMESMSSWARQYVEQLPRPQVDRLEGIAPSVAIEQRVTRGSQKSTVATITEIAQYLRVMFARIGIQHSPITGEPLVALSELKLIALIKQRVLKSLKRNGTLSLYIPLIRARKGHHEPLAKWAIDHDYSYIKVDGEKQALVQFQKLDRYREHDIDLLLGEIHSCNNKELYVIVQNKELEFNEAINHALKIGKQSLYLEDDYGKSLGWFSTKRSDPHTGESYPDLDPKNFSWNSARGWCEDCHGHGSLYSWMKDDEQFSLDINILEDGQKCPSCQGDRLNPVSRSVYIQTNEKELFNLPQILALPPELLIETLQNLKLDKRARAIVKELYPEIVERLKFLSEVGLTYLSLDRATNTLSGGESQRIRLASQLGSNLSGVLYVLDEPSIGLHSRDNQRLIKSLNRLKERGNTLLVVEHDTETMKAADKVIDLGPGAGIHGGEILAQGTLAQLKKSKKSITGEYLRKSISHPQQKNYRTPPSPFSKRSKKSLQSWVYLEEPTLRNLKGNSVGFAKGQLNVVCGISGAGKSTLVRDVLKPAVEEAIEQNVHRLSGPSTVYKTLYGANSFNKVVEVDQSPIGKTPRSTPATYIGAFDRIRRFFAELPESKIYGYTAGTFSFNSKGGRCENCKGASRVKLEMSFMPDAYLPCDECNETRYSSALRSIRWNGKNISDVLQMSFEEAATFFEFDSALSRLLKLMVQTGLGYLTLGQSSPTLSGGEAQRLKMVSELAKGLGPADSYKKGLLKPNLYILEEPTIGLHLHDCKKLINLFHQMINQGHTLIVIEHHLDILLEADHLIEIGPEGGEAGGRLLYQGCLKNLHHVKDSPTLPFLKNSI